MRCRRRIIFFTASYTFSTVFYFLDWNSKPFGEERISRERFFLSLFFSDSESFFPMMKGHRWPLLNHLVVTCVCKRKAKTLRACQVIIAVRGGYQSTGTFRSRMLSHSCRPPCSAINNNNNNREVVEEEVEVAVVLSVEATGL